MYFSRSRSSEAVETIEEDDVLFKGFDLNDNTESKYYSFYRFIVEQQGGYNFIKDFIETGKIEDYNSHGFGPSMKKLADMIEKREKIKFRDEYHRARDLTVEEIKEILNA